MQKFKFYVTKFRGYFLMKLYNYIKIIKIFKILKDNRTIVLLYMKKTTSLITGAHLYNKLIINYVYLIIPHIIITIYLIP